jgi:hypothetical protein
MRRIASAAAAKKWRPLATGGVRHKSHVRLVHEPRRIQRLTRLLLCELCGGELTEFVVHERQQLIGRARILGVDGVQDLRDVGHEKPQRRFRGLSQNFLLRPSAKPAF